MAVIATKSAPCTGLDSVYGYQNKAAEILNYGQLVEVVTALHSWSHMFSTCKECNRHHVARLYVDCLRRLEALYLPTAHALEQEGLLAPHQRGELVRMKVCACALTLSGPSTVTRRAITQVARQMALRPAFRIAIGLLRNWDDEPLLVRAVRTSNIQGVRLLLDHGCQLNEEDDDGQTALMRATQVADWGLSFVRQLIAAKADVHAVAHGGRRALHLAASGGDPAVVTELLKGKASLQAADHQGYMPLHQAAARGQLKTVQLLLEGGARADAETSIPAHLKEDAFIMNRTCLEGETALHTATQVKKGELFAPVIRLLLDSKASLNAQDSEGRTPLHQAAHRGKELIIEQLLEQQSDLELQDEEGRTALQIAASQGHSVVVKTLLQAKANPNAVAKKSGRTPLHAAVGHGLNRHAIVRLLLEAKASTVALDAEQNTALALAKQGNYEALANLLTNPTRKRLDVDRSRNIQ
jgi:ankyrin repeat protein